jgi:hypothetical protein
MSTWGKLKDVKSVNVASFDTWKVSSGLFDTIFLVVIDNKWSLSHDIP